MYLPIQSVKCVMEKTLYKNGRCDCRGRLIEENNDYPYPAMHKVELDKSFVIPVMKTAMYVEKAVNNDCFR
jgi:hypothetical protein